jgi:hypothetical protein
MTFTPTILGSDPGTLTVADSASNSPQTAALTGTGILPVTLDPSSWYFGTVLGGNTSAAKSMTLTNHQNVALAFSSLVTTGDFAIASNTCGTSIAAGAKCTVDVTFSPTAAGVRTGALTFTDNAANSPQTVSLTGTGSAPVTISPASLAFGSQPVGMTSGAQTVKLTNHLTTSLVLSTPVATGDFAVASNNCPATLGSGHGCSIGVTFTPGVVGSRTGRLTIPYAAWGSPSVLVLSGTGSAPVLVSIAVTPAHPSILWDQTQQFTATGKYSDGSTQNLTSTATWSSSAPGVATINAGGLASGVAVGGTTITAASGGVQGTTPLTVTAPLVSIAVTPANPSVIAGKKQQFTATGNYSNGNTLNLTSTATWSSSAPSVATITAGGLAKGMTAGASTISATLSNITGSTTLTVTARVLVSVAVTPANPFIAPGTTQQFTATGTYSDGSTQNLTRIATWSSSAPGVATISTAGLASTVGTGQTTIESALGAINGSTTLTVRTLTVGGFTLTGSMNSPRYYHTAILLNDGMVLIAGGHDSSVYLTSAELYNPVTGAFTPTGSLKTARDCATATLLNNGMVLIAGGAGGATAELYNPATGTFTPTGNMNTARSWQTATLLNNGMVLMAGGWYPSIGFVASAELYNPATGTFSYTGSMNTARAYATATLLNNGMVLIAGGQASGSLASAELYNPATETFTYTTGSLNTARGDQTATLLNNGMVLMAGGWNYPIALLASAELYDLATGTFTPTASMNTVREYQTATLLNSSMVLIAGGCCDSSGNSLANAELYTPATETFTYTTGSLNNGRAGSTATLLNDGTVLMAGGYSSSGALASAELYLPLTLTSPNLESIAITPVTSTLSPGTTQQFIATGTFSDGSTQQLASVTWSSSNPTVAQITNDWSNHGMGLAIAAGTVTITAMDGSVSGTATLTVQ